jgi:hypothetical protein
VTNAPTRVDAREIADLLAWARSLSKQGLNADPAERAAFFAAKTELLARIAAAQPLPPLSASPGGEA